MKRLETIQKERVKIDGLDDFPLKLVGLTIDSIEKSGGHVKIPIELLPYIKICKMPVLARKQKAKTQFKYLLKLRRKNRRSPKKGGNR
jgi:hypothetical protein